MSTFLEIVNDVLVRLRDDEVTSVASSAYSKLIGKLVNDTKREVEDAWQWSQLRTYVSVTTTAGTTNYSLTGTNKRSRIMSAHNTSIDIEIRRISDQFYNSLTLYGAGDANSAMYYRVRGYDASGQMKVDVYPTPRSPETLFFDCVIPQDTLAVDGTADSTELALEPTVVIYGAWSKAISERGEDGGALFEEVYGMYRRALADAISYDVAQHHEGETDWYPV
jgi:hypothetical protein